MKDRLTIEEVESIAFGDYDAFSKASVLQIAKQLADTMRENEQLRKLLTPCQHITQDNISSDQTAGKNICRDCLAIIDYANKESE